MQRIKKSGDDKIVKKIKSKSKKKLLPVAVALENTLKVCCG